MLKKLKKFLQKHGLIVKSIEAYYNKMNPKHSHGEYQEGLLVIQWENNTFTNILSTVRSVGSAELVLEVGGEDKILTFDHTVFLKRDCKTVGPMLQEYGIDLDELIKEVWKKNNKLLPNSTVKGS